MKKWLTLFFIGLFFCMVSVLGIFFVKKRQISYFFKHSILQLPLYQEKRYYLFPGNVANVFGWGYNRSSCFLPSKSQTIQFFFAEDNHLYYALSSHMENYLRVDFPIAVNPDFDVHCLSNEKIALSFSDLDQHMIFYGELFWKNNMLEWDDVRLATDSGEYRSAVAPMSRVLDKSRFISFLSFGYPGTDRTSDATVVWSDMGSVDSFGANEWHTQKLFSINPEISQIMGISLENYRDTLIAILVHPDSTVYFSYFDKEKQNWGKPIKQQIHIGGHLEWKTLATQDAIYFIYRNLEQKLELAKLVNGMFEITTLDQLSLNAMSIFEDQKAQIFLLYNDSKLRKIAPGDITLPVSIEATESSSFYFGQVAPFVGDSIFYSSVGGTDGKYMIQYHRSNWPVDQNWKKDESIEIKKLPLMK